MAAIQTFLKSGLRRLQDLAGASSTALGWRGNSIPAIYDTDEKFEEVDFGGKNPQGTRATVLVATEDFPNSDRPKLGESVTWIGQQWRVERLRNGDAGTHIEIFAEHKRSGGG